PADTRVTLEGVVLAGGALGSPEPVDPGEHTLTVTAAGRQNGVFTVRLVERQALEVTVGPGAPSALAPLAPRSDARGDAGARPGALRTAGFVAFGVGAAALAVGGIAGAVALSKKNTMNDHCDADFACDDVGL